MAVRMRTLSFGTLRIFASVTLLPETPCVGTCSVKRSAALSKAASATRGSIDTTATRVLTMSSFVTCAAVANAASIFALSP